MIGRRRCIKFGAPPAIRRHAAQAGAFSREACTVEATAVTGQKMKNGTKDRKPAAQDYDAPGYAMRQSEDTGRQNSMIEGRNAVTEAIRAGRSLDKIYAAGASADRTLRRILSMARDAGAVIVECDRRKLDAMSMTHAHQGIIAVAAAKEYARLEDILEAAKNSPRPPLLVLCDGITDEHNLGAIIRTAEAAGAHGVVIPKRRSAGVTAVTEKTSAGAVEHMPVARVSNLSAAIKELKKQGVWIFGTAADVSESLYDTDLRGACALVIGSEGRGMSRLVSEQCDRQVSIPMSGKTSSLNASAAAAVFLYEAVRQRR